MEIVSSTSLSYVQESSRDDGRSQMKDGETHKIAPAEKRWIVRNVDAFLFLALNLFCHILIFIFFETIR